MKFDTLRLILGDQLNREHSWFQQPNENTLYVMAELAQETGYVKHHVQKICAFFAAMRAFAQELRQAGHHVCYFTLDESAAYADLPALLHALCDSHSIRYFEYQQPDEYRLHQQLAALALPVESLRSVDSEHFLLPFSDISSHFKPGQHRLMEHFYRQMRKQSGILLDTEGKPEGGKWNYDSKNRRKLSAKDITELPKPLEFRNDVRPILSLLEKHQVNHFGQADEWLLWPINRAQSLTLLAHFCQVCLPRFGYFQDAMTGEHESQWSLYHSRLSFAINSKILSPREVIDAAIRTYHQAKGAIDIAQIEGFVRQILGWREYVRGVYWSNMPHYATLNYWQASRPIPSYFWTGKTKMRCLQHALTQSLQHAYAHHIQRLMVIGNFTLLSQCHPDEVDAWYLGVYIDALEWVEMPNTRGMALFADGGIVGTKPYTASGAYIDKMSDYCKKCHYQVKQRSGPGSCPFNSLYWHFVHQHDALFSQHPRLGLVYRNWLTKPEHEQQAILETAKHYLIHLERL
ncbi:cryptochrome/photolyase family protein [Vibrio cidicii]|nr:cryptochrome/photolyase family protein [Vibrio cidicii]